MTEITRRNPGELRIRETHPGHGLFDCLGVMDASGRNLLSLNRSGTLRLIETMDGKRLSKSESDFFGKLLSGSGFGAVVHAICRELGIPAYKILPPTTPNVLVYRYISALLEYAVTAKRSWECRSGFFETTGMGEGMRPEFDEFPRAKGHFTEADWKRRGPLPTAFGYWFLQVKNRTELCLSTDGLVWDRKGRETNLFPEYREHRRIWPLLSRTAGFLLA